MSENNYDTEITKNNRRIFDLKNLSEDKMITPENKNVGVMRIESSGGRGSNIKAKRSNTQVKEMVSLKELRNQSKVRKTQ